MHTMEVKHMAKIKAKFSDATGKTLEIEVENETSVAEVLEAMADAGLSIGEKASLNGRTAEGGEAIAEGDVVSTHKSPEGGF